VPKLEPSETVAKRLVRRYLNGNETVRMRNSPANGRQRMVDMTARDALTKNQMCVLEKLEAASGPLSAY
ncbi:hypothetical protein, partial [Klebsiella aerogenes]|uniref:hypothetical protein n=1 Tax=Klebsiella aerogenes TaxID=548 RepID=UPI0019540BB0